jgi:hypothetical protein
LLSGREERSIVICRHLHFCLTAVGQKTRVDGLMNFELNSITLNFATRSLRPYRSQNMAEMGEVAKPSVLILGGINTVARHLAVFLCGNSGSNPDSKGPFVKVRT